MKEGGASVHRSVSRRLVAGPGGLRQLQGPDVMGGFDALPRLVMAVQRLSIKSRMTRRVVSVGSYCFVPL